MSARWKLSFILVLLLISHPVCVSAEESLEAVASAAITQETIDFLENAEMLQDEMSNGCPPGWTKKRTNRNHPQGCWSEYTYPARFPGEGPSYCTEVRHRFLGFCLDIEIISIISSPGDERFEETLIH